MTDKEIVKAWEKVLKTSDEPIGEHWGCSVTTKLAKETFDMLNRQKAEIERLKELLKSSGKYINKLEKEMIGVMGRYDPYTDSFVKEMTESKSE